MVKIMQNYHEKYKIYPAIVVLSSTLPLRVFPSAHSLRMSEVASIIYHWNLV